MICCDCGCVLQTRQTHDSAVSPPALRHRGRSNCEDDHRVRHDLAYCRCRYQCECEDVHQDKCQRHRRLKAPTPKIPRGPPGFRVTSQVVPDKRRKSITVEYFQPKKMDSFGENSTSPRQHRGIKHKIICVVEVQSNAITEINRKLTENSAIITV